MTKEKNHNPESVVREIRRKTRKKYSSEEKIRIVLEGLKGEESIATMARNVCALDDEVDEMNRDIYQKVKDAIRNRPTNMDSYIHILGISRHLERIADHTTNIAEDVIYMIEGIITRHRSEDYTVRTDKSKT